MSYVFAIAAGLATAVMLAVLEAPTKLCVAGAVVVAALVSATWNRP